MAIFVEQDSRTWNRRVRDLAYMYLVIHQCQKCGNPVVEGYICQFCGDTNPTESKTKTK